MAKAEVKSFHSCASFVLSVTLFLYNHCYPEAGYCWGLLLCLPFNHTGQLLSEYPYVCSRVRQFHFAGLWCSGTESWGLHSPHQHIFHSLFAALDEWRMYQNTGRNCSIPSEGITKKLPESGYIRNQNTILTQGKPFQQWNSEICAVLCRWNNKKRWFSQLHDKWYLLIRIKKNINTGLMF